MFCPQCGITENDDLKFCKSCGANLQAVRQVVTLRETGEKFDWSKTWVAEMLLSEDENRKRKRQHQDQFVAEEKRYREIKAGVITSSIGLALMIFLSIFMEGVVESGVPRDAAMILRQVWVAGIIPFFIGLGLILNGVIVSKKLVDLARREFQQKETARNLERFEKPAENGALPAADWYAQSHTPGLSVTEHTTRQLKDSE